MISGIYSIINIRNNKIYVGSTKNIEMRKYSHFNTLRRNVHVNKYLQRAYNKYGKDSFMFTVIEYCSVDRLLEREIFWIIHYKSTDNLFGYNNMIPCEHGITHSIETRKRISVKNRISRKKIIQYDKNGCFIKLWDGGKDAISNIPNLTPDGISQAIKEKRKCGGFYWRLYNETLGTKNIIINKRTNKGASKEVILKNDVEQLRFESMTAAGSFLGLGCAAVSAAKINKRKIKGYIVEVTLKF